MAHKDLEEIEVVKSEEEAEITRIDPQKDSNIDKAPIEGKPKQISKNFHNRLSWLIESKVPVPDRDFCLIHVKRAGQEPALSI